MVVLRVAGQPRGHLVELELREDRDPVEGLLAVDRDVVAQRLERLARKALVHTFRFLQANDVGRPLRSQAVRFSIRCLIELTFQVAMRMAGRGRLRRARLTNMRRS